MNKDNLKLLDRYLMICRNKGLTDNSIKAFRTDLLVFFNYIEDRHVSEINHIDIEDFLSYCINYRKNGDLAINRKFTSLNTFYDNMIRKDYLDMKNPMHKLDKPKVRKKQRGHLTEDEMNKVFEYLKSTNNLRGLAIISLFYSSGIRLSELYQLNKNTLNFETRRFLVKGKGEKERIAIFSEKAKIYIQNYLNTRDDDIEALFISREKNRISRRALQRLVKDTVKRAGINKNVSPHQIRHSTAMTLLKKKIPLDKIQGVLGHENISTTQIYAHNTIDDVQEVVDGLL